jgi:hypothetical protein
MSISRWQARHSRLTLNLSKLDRPVSRIDPKAGRTKTNWAVSKESLNKGKYYVFV